MDSLSHTTRIVTKQDLKHVGFSEEQIAELDELRRSYPLLEFLDSRQEWNRLAFMKWRIEQEDAEKVRR